MQRSLQTPLTFYPAYCFNLSPTHSTWARLGAVDIHALTEHQGFEGQNIYFHLNHPIKWIRLVGLVVAFDVFPGVYILTVDDSSGSTIEVKYNRPTATAPGVDDGTSTALAVLDAGRAPATNHALDTNGFTATGRRISLVGVDIGSVVKIKGGIKVYRGQKQVTLERITLVKTTTEEAEAWAENTAFYHDVLSKPWVVTKAEAHKAQKGLECAEKKQRRHEERERRSMESSGEKERRRREAEKQRQLKAEADRLRREEQERTERQAREEEVKARRQRVEVEERMAEVRRQKEAVEAETLRRKAEREVRLQAPTVDPKNLSGKEQRYDGEAWRRQRKRDREWRALEEESRVEAERRERQRQEVEERKAEVQRQRAQLELERRSRG